MKTKNNIVSFLVMLILTLSIGIGLTSLNNSAKAKKKAQFGPNMVNYFTGLCDPIPIDCGPETVITPDESKIH